jgi:arylsulfatase
MLGQRSIYHQGWLACTVHPPISGWGHFDKDVWQLYHLERDRAQTVNLAEQEPERLQTLKELWFYHAGICNGLPLDDRTALEQVLAERPHSRGERGRYTYHPDCTDVPEEAGVPINGRSFTIVAGAELDSADAEGVLFATGGIIGGHSLYIKDRRLHYVYNWIGTHLQDVVADRDVTPGRHALTAEFALQGQNEDPAMPGFAGTLTLYIDEDVVGSGKIVTQPGAFCLVGDGISIGRDSASPVTPDYRSPFPFTGGQIDKVVVDVSGEQYVDHEAQVRAWLMRD